MRSGYEGQLEEGDERERDNAYFVHGKSTDLHFKDEYTNDGTSTIKCRNKRQMTLSRLLAQASQKIGTLSACPCLINLAASAAFQMETTTTICPNVQIYTIRLH